MADLNQKFTNIVEYFLYHAILLYISHPEMNCPKHSVPNGYAANFCKFSHVYVIELVLDRFAHRRTKSNFSDRWVVGLQP